MKRMLLTFTALLFVTVNLCAIAQAQQLEKFLSKIKMGEWIEFEGPPQPDFTILVNEIKVLRGEMEDDDWEVSGAVSRVATEEKTIYILNLPIKFDNNTEYDDDLGVIKSFADIKPGMTVEVEGQYTMDGVFLAAEVESKKFKADEKNFVKWTGKVEGVEPESRSINILGHVIILTPETKIKSFLPE